MMNLKNNSQDNQDIKTDLHTNILQSTWNSYLDSAKQDIDNNNVCYLVNSNDLKIIKEHVNFIPDEIIFYHASIQLEKKHTYDFYCTNFSRIILMKDMTSHNPCIHKHIKYTYHLTDDQIIIIRSAMKSLCSIADRSDLRIYVFVDIIFELVFKGNIAFSSIPSDLLALLAREKIYLLPNEKIFIHSSETDESISYKIFCTNYSRFIIMKCLGFSSYLYDYIEYNYWLNDKQIIALESVINAINRVPNLKYYATKKRLLINYILKSIMENNKDIVIDHKSKTEKYDKQDELSKDKQNDLYTEIQRLTEQLDKVTQENKDLHKKINVYVKLQSLKSKRNRLKNEIHMIKTQLRDN